MTDHSDLTNRAREQASKRAVDSPIYTLLHELADALETTSPDATEPWDEVNLLAELAAVKSERDEAFAVIAQAKEAYYADDSQMDTEGRMLQMLDQSPAATLTEVKATVMDQAAELALGPSKYLRDGSTCRQIANDLHEEADRIRKEQS